MAAARTRRSRAFPSGVNYKTVVVQHEEILTLWSKGVILVPATEILDYTRPPTELPIPIVCQVYATNPSTSEEEDSEFVLSTPNDSLLLSWGTDTQRKSTHGRDIIVAESLVDVPGAGGIAQRRTLRQFVLPHIGEMILAASFPAVNMHVGINLADNLDNNALVLSLLPEHAVPNSSEILEIQGGHPSSRLSVLLAYILVKL
jgi:hypothetical protein